LYVKNIRNFSFCLNWLFEDYSISMSDQSFALVRYDLLYPFKKNHLFRVGNCPRFNWT
jgi:hypothetical protein